DPARVLEPRNGRRGHRERDSRVPGALRRFGIIRGGNAARTDGERSMSMRQVLLAVALAGAAASPLVLHAQTPARKIVCWTGENGHRACGDRGPPQYARQERQVYDASGRVVETIGRQKTPDEIAEAERRAAEQEAGRKRAEEQAAYDRFMLTSFSSVAELER